MFLGSLGVSGSIFTIISTLTGITWGLGAIDQVSPGTIEKGRDVLKTVGEGIKGFGDALNLNAAEVAIILGAIDILGNTKSGNAWFVVGALAVSLAISAIVGTLIGITVGLGAIDQANPEKIEKGRDAFVKIGEGIAGFGEAMNKTKTEIEKIIPGLQGLHIADSIIASFGLGIMSLILGGICFGLGSIDSTYPGIIEKGKEVIISISDAVSGLASSLDSIRKQIDMLIPGLSSFTAVSDGAAVAITLGSAALFGLISALVGLVQESTNGEAGKMITEGMDTIVDIVNGIGRMFSALTKGIFGDEINEKDLSTENIKSFGEAFGIFREAVTGLSSEEGFEVDINAATKNAEDLYNWFEAIGEKIPDGTKLQLFNSRLTSLFGDIADFGTVMGDYHKEISGLSTSTISDDTNTAITNAESVHRFMIKITEESDKLEKDKGIFEKLFNGDTIYDQVLGFISSFGVTMGVAAQNLSGLSGTGTNSFSNNMRTSLKMIKEVADLLIDFGDEGKYASINTGNLINIGTAVDGLETVATRLNAINSSWEGMNFDTLYTFSEVLENLTNIFSSTDGLNIDSESIKVNLDPEPFANAVTEFADGITDAISSAIERIQKAYEELLETIKGKEEPETPQPPKNTPSTEQMPQVKPEDVDVSGLKTAGQNGAEAFGEGMASVDLSSDTNSVVGKAVAAADSGKSDFVTVGKHFTEGLAQGVEDGSAVSSLTSAIKRVVQKAIEAAKQVSDENSPSKEFAKVGRFFSLGMAVGVDETGGDVVKSTENVVKTMLSTAKGSMATLSQLLAEDIDDTPVIRPVVDLSNARSAAATIGDMFNGSRNFGLETRELANKASDANQTRLNARNNQNGSGNSGSSKNTNISTGVNITGNNFYVRDETDIYTLGSEIASLSKQQQRSYGATV